MDLRRSDKRTNLRGRRVEDRHLVLLDHLPEASRVGIRWDSLEHHFGGATGQRAVCNVGVPRYPSDVCRAPEYVAGLEVEHPSHGEHRPKQIPTRAVLNAL